MKRILIPIVGQGSIASVIRTGLIDSMQSFCTPVICILWQQADLIDELKAKGYEVYLMPKIKFSDPYILLRLKINYGYQKYILKTQSIRIEYAYKKHFLKTRKRLSHLKTRTKYNWSFKMQPGLLDKLKMQESVLIENEDCYKAYSEWLGKVKADGIYTVAPFLPEIELAGRLLKKESKLLLAAIHSFDNVTKRPWSPVMFDAYSVWNAYNKNELLRIYPGLSKKDIYINGAPQFDFHFDDNFLMDRQEWKEMLGIKAPRKIILYAGGWQGATPHEDQYVRHIMEGIRSGAIEGNPVLLLRGHPLDTLERWENIKKNYPEIVMDVLKQGDEKFDFSNITETDIKRFCSTLHYADVHVNLVSTMAVDGAAHYKPQVAPFYDTVKGQRDLRNLYYQEHYVPVVKSGALAMAKSPALLQQFINSALQQPAKFTSANDHLLKEIITYTDGKSAQRVLKYLKANIA